MRLFLLLIAAAAAAFAQRPPVLLVDGYHIICGTKNLTSQEEFGELQQRLEAQGVRVAYFGTCSVSGKPPIETLAKRLGEAIVGLNAAQVDVISNSLGGLVVRAYLAGKQPGGFTPPRDTKVRKWISIATPNFGALIPSFLVGLLPDEQARQLVPGSQFLFDLATWNQHRDDLRGVDAVAIAGNAGGLGSIEGSNDGTVALTSASLSFALPDKRTRILPYCHGAESLTSLLGLGCNGPPMAQIRGDNPLSWLVVNSFLAGTNDWQSAGHSPSEDKFLSRNGGTLTQARDNLDRPTGALVDKPFVLNAPTPGGYTALIEKPGPAIALAASSAARLPYLSLAPGMLVSIYGTDLDNPTVAANGAKLDLNYSGPFQINALLPPSVTGLVTVTVENQKGKASTNIYIEETAPAIFAALRVGGYSTIYLTGLGGRYADVRVTLNGEPLRIAYSGPSPGFAGLDQINVELPFGGASGSIVVTAGGRQSNSVTLGM